LKRASFFSLDAPSATGYTREILDDAQDYKDHAAKQTMGLLFFFPSILPTLWTGCCFVDLDDLRLAITRRAPQQWINVQDKAVSKRNVSFDNQTFRL
jgi:hypothetical protein